MKLVQAFHSSTTPDGVVTYASGLVINFAGQTVYHLGDTCLFGDLQLIAARRRPSTSRSCRSEATTRWTATTRSWPRS